MAQSVCPWWLGYMLVSPLRRVLGHRPEETISPYLREGMTALDIGSGMGFFTIPMAKIVGPKGRVYAVDLQEKMIRSLKRRVAKVGLDQRVDARVCSETSLKIKDLAESIHFALTFAMVHEVPDKPRLFSEIFHALKDGGLLFIAEPNGHVSAAAFEETIRIAEQLGFSRVEAPQVPRCTAMVLKKFCPTISATKGP